jgi:fumarate reductase flavoprotein subunit
MELTRRSFVSGTAAAATVAAVAATSAGSLSSQSSAPLAPTVASAKAPTQDTSWLGEAPDIAESDIVETRECELLIIGAGNAGMAAAATAAELGMDIIVAEKGEAVGDTRHWLGAVNSKYVLEAGVEDDKGKLLNELARYASGKCDQRVWKVWIDESASMIDWLDPILTGAGMTCAVDTDNQDPTGGTLYYIPYTEHYYSGKDAEGNRIVRNQVLENYINSLGYKVSYSTTLVKLEQDASGRVTGGIFETADGYVRINASEGTLLATGGYAANPQMVLSRAPIIDRVVSLVYYNTKDTGDGIKAAMWLGAQMDENAAPMLFNRGLVKPGEDAGYTSTEGTGSFAGQGKQYNIGSQPFLKVARDGRRYCNESMPYDFDLNAIAEKPGGVFCQVFDSNVKEDIKRFNTIGCSRQIQQQLAYNDDVTVEDFFADKVEEGTMQVADTLDELADKLGFEGDAKETFLATCDHYNEMFDAQEDDEFYKEAYRLSELRNPPFYGAWYGGSFLTTVDGLRIDENMRVLDVNDEPIDGLFAAGDCSGSLFADNYPELCVACACGRTVTFGRHVARYVAEQAGYDLDAVTAGDPTYVDPEKAAAESAKAEQAAAAASGSYKDGTYEGTGTGHGGEVPVTITVEGGKITSVEVGENQETQGIGSKAIEQLPAAIVAAGSLDGVDAVAGATQTSQAIFDAVTAALAEAAA